jgi:phosphomannomutase/phosphomannomutase/phosphoglucomutase
MRLNCFKAYDIRGRLGDELNEEIAWRIGRAYVQLLNPKKVAVGGDARLSSEELKSALSRGLAEAGAEVLDLGLTGTEEIYFAVFSQNLDGGLMVTGSHNPLSDNGMKLVREGSRPISGDSGLFEIRDLVASEQWSTTPTHGSVKRASFKNEYIDHLLGYIDLSQIRPLTLVVNAGNGAAGPVLDLLEQRLIAAGTSLKFIKINHEPDGRFPNGIPNPLLPENRGQTSQAVRDHQADLGLAWDGDFDRCFFFDEFGNFIEGYYLVGLLAESVLAGRPGGVIIHDPRLTWNTIELVEQAGGRPIESKTGHAFIKERMRREAAVYGGEMSAHHYFADFAYCDSGMIPWLLILELMSRKKQPLSALVAERQAKYPCSGEINYKVNDVDLVLARVYEHFVPQALQISRVDGLSMEMEQWRFNLRASNTEPLLRLNLETRGIPDAVADKVAEIESLLK